ncbi:MAG: symmetrical bis(5'-nucleosyl)-tetraphosphatase [Magnetococcales bacterium]|nr:symmetrical bis(5'-nucleosyl)-tetraphosphatase [Magnetococcales bacterium]
MAVYAVGDVHGSLPELKALLTAIGFRASRDRLWFVGDVINRGPDSLGTLRFIRDLGDRAITLMGNHEARALMGLSGHGDPLFDSQMGFLTQAPDVEEWYTWLRGLPLLHHDPELETVMVHAGVHPDWTLEDAKQRAEKLHEILQDDEQIGPFFSDAEKIFSAVEEDATACLNFSNADLKNATNCLRFAFSVMTRIRLCEEKGRLVWSNPALTSAKSDLLPLRPWYELVKWPEGLQVVYGHWAAAGLNAKGRFLGLDSGCVYGGQLTAVRLDHPGKPLIQVPCPCYVAPEAG